VKQTRKLLEDLLNELEKAASFTRDGRDTFLKDERTQYAVIRCYEVIGEIVKRLPDDFRNAYPQVNWRELAGFRDFLAHNYDEIILVFMWAAVEDLPNLRGAIEDVLSELD
jgi:uncharacterized protein with HEPN domain